jgi:hypothetical protein
MKETTKRWIAAGTLLATDPDAKVRCPECEREYLVVMDVPIEGSNDSELPFMECNVDAKEGTKDSGVKMQ